jgi:hypothetical protein
MYTVPLDAHVAYLLKKIVLPEIMPVLLLLFPAPMSRFDLLLSRFVL